MKLFLEEINIDRKKNTVWTNIDVVYSHISPSGSQRPPGVHEALLSSQCISNPFTVIEATIYSYQSYYTYTVNNDNWNLKTILRNKKRVLRIEKN